MQIPLKLDPSGCLQTQLFEQFRDLILGGQLKPGTRMVPTRVLSHELEISRNTVMLAYDRLIAEGYFQARQSVGVFVSSDLPEECLRVRREPATTRLSERQARRQPVVFSGNSQAVVNPHRRPLAIDFWLGRCDPESFPRGAWVQLLKSKLAPNRSPLSEYGSPAGLPELRRAISEYLGPARGINTTPEQVIVVSGCQQGLDVVSRLFLKPGSRAVVEAPCYQGAAFLFQSYGAILEPIKVKGEGLEVAALPSSPVAVAYVTPSHQYPLGMTLPLEARLRLLNWAWQVGAYILEDDYDSDFRYQGPPLTALKGLDAHGCVIYLGTFSKSIGAGLRLGYLVVPRELVGPATTVKALTDNGNPWLEQTVLAEFIASGGYVQHLRRIRRIYQQRRDRLVEALRRNFGEVTLLGRDSGMHLVWMLPPRFPTAVELQNLALQRGVGIYSLPAGAAFEPEPGPYSDRAVLLGYSSLTERQIDEGIDRIAQAVASRPASPGRDNRAVSAVSMAV